MATEASARAGFEEVLDRVIVLPFDSPPHARTCSSRGKVGHRCARGYRHGGVTRPQPVGPYRAFWKAVDGCGADAVELQRALELARLDALQVGLWERAEAGDVMAVMAVLRIIEVRTLLLGMDKPQVVPAGPNSVVDPASWERLKETRRAENRTCWRCLGDSAIGQVSGELDVRAHSGSVS